MIQPRANIPQYSPRTRLVRAVLSLRYEVGVSLLLAPAGADKRGPFFS